MKNVVKNKINGFKTIMKNTYYAKYYYNAKLKDNLILLESKNGSDLAGNIFHILKALSTEDYKDYKVCLVVSKDKKKVLKDKIEKNHLRHVEYVYLNSRRYYQVISTAKYIFTDTSMERVYVKKEGQIITNTWHGTPLKYMGQDVEDRIYAMGNVQRNLLMADYLVYPNDFMREKMVSAYGLEDLYQGTILCEGYPRNSVFFDANAGSNIRGELGLEGKKVYIYMPTWRGLLTKKESDKLLFSIEYFMKPLDRMLTDDQVFYVKLHPFVEKDMDFSGYKHIKPYPAQYDVYEFMNTCDCLITDYSSVFFDFANTKKKIILFAYDEAEYIQNRGMYLDLKDLPFPVVKTAKQLADELKIPKNYDDTEFLKRCCTYDGPGAAERICRHVIKGDKVCKEIKLPKSGKETVVMYSSTLAKNGLTASLVNLFENIDLNKRNYYVSFMENSLRKFPLRVKQIPDNVGFIPISSKLAPTFMEKIALLLYEKKNKNNNFVQKYLDRMYKREVTKHFGSIKIDVAIQFAGYEKYLIRLFQEIDAKRIIYVHNDMLEELRTKTNQHRLTLESAYRNYDIVAAVTKDLVESTREIGGEQSNIKVINNCHAYQTVREKAEKEIVFDPDTKSNVSEEELKKILDSDAVKFINVGRFSNEKGHKMLMRAFERFSKKYPNSYLIIIGGYGKLYGETLAYANNSLSNIIIIRSISNPIAVMKRCDLFVLSSYYEGLGLTLLEADTIGIPTISTDVQGPRGFVNEHGGVLVDTNEDGIYQGMMRFMKGEIKAMNVDYQKYNEKAVEQFESMFE